MEAQTTQYIQKLKESILINQSLLTLESETHKDLNEFNLKFQEILQQALDRSQAALPVLESLTDKLTEEENQVLIQFATQTTVSQQQFFEIWKGYKELEAKTAADLTATAEKIKSFVVE